MCGWGIQLMMPGFVQMLIRCSRTQNWLVQTPCHFSLVCTQARDQGHRSLSSRDSILKSIILLSNFKFYFQHHRTPHYTILQQQTKRCYHMCCLLQLWCHPGGYPSPPTRIINIQVPGPLTGRQ